MTDTLPLRPIDTVQLVIVPPDTSTWRHPVLRDVTRVSPETTDLYFDADHWWCTARPYVEECPCYATVLIWRLDARTLRVGNTLARHEPQPARNAWLWILRELAERTDGPLLRYLRGGGLIP